MEPFAGVVGEAARKLADDGLVEIVLAADRSPHARRAGLAVAVRTEKVTLKRRGGVLVHVCNVSIANDSTLTTTPSTHFRKREEVGAFRVRREDRVLVRRLLPGNKVIRHPHEALVVREAPLAGRCAPRCGGVPLHVLHDRVVRRLRPVRQKRIRHVRRHGDGKVRAGDAIRPRGRRAQAGVDHRRDAVDHRRRAGPNRNIVVWLVVPHSNGEVRPLYEIRRHGVANNRAFRPRMRLVDVQLVKGVVEFVDGVVEGEVGVVDAAARVADVELREVAAEVWTLALVVAGTARPVAALIGVVEDRSQRRRHHCQAENDTDQKIIIIKHEYQKKF
eukprot:PhM_4_TR14035/c0_g1_i1/m.98144